MVVGNAPEDVGFTNSNAARCGVDAIPFLVLVGRDGTVSDIHLRGEALGKRLAELFPEVDGDTAGSTSGSVMNSVDDISDIDEVELGGDVELEDDVEATSS